jgi:hypothetical protein
MSNGVILLIIFIAFAVVISHLNGLRKNAKQKMRPKSLNELQETLPRTAKNAQKQDNVGNKKP